MAHLFRSWTLVVKMALVVARGAAFVPLHRERGARVILVSGGEGSPSFRPVMRFGDVLEDRLIEAVDFTEQRRDANGYRNALDDQGRINFTLWHGFTNSFACLDVGVRSAPFGDLP
jgi:hypothetical protein